MAPQDTFFEDDEETCPLCIEEFDLSDKNFRPCPCGYQVCQFCFHNIKTNMNGLCPACRRPYSDDTIQYKVVTAEEQAEFRAAIQKNKKKRAEQQGQKEVQKRDAEKEGRKSLIGIRVVQKNLVYVTGLTPTVQEDELLKTLRQPQFFGQYGNIQKISISNRKNQEGQNQSLGIYVTFDKKEDAQRCIQAVNGSQNGDRVLRAQLGTTKYCSAWLRHETCTNRQCMFLHELGDEEDSYTRQDLSSLNSINTQRPLANAGGPASRSVSRQQVQPHPNQASQPMARTSSKDGSESGDASALPSSANWARTTQQRSRRGSHATSGAASSPAVSMALPVTNEASEEALELPPREESSAPTPLEATMTLHPSFAPAAGVSAHVERDARDVWLTDLLKTMGSFNFSLKAADGDSSDLVPPLFDVRGGARRRAMREEEEPRPSREQEEQTDVLEPSEEEPESGSLALGGEPEDRDSHGRESHGFDQRRAIAQPPIQRTNNDGLFGPTIGSSYPQGAANITSISNRSMTPQQQPYMRPAGFVDLPPGITTAQSSLFQGQGHNRQSSRFNFANESSSTSTSVKLAANPRLMAQQSAMMPSAFHSQTSAQFYPSSLPGPPPGLKSTATPPNMFGQGSAFGNSGFGAKDSNEILQSLIRGRGGVGQAHDAGKREYNFPYSHHQYLSSSSSTPAPAPGFLALYCQPGAIQDFGARQKKHKGKKSRHANTSSNGGSGVVDDPSILQARLQHHQQSNAGGVGAGLFGGQASVDDYVFEDDATTNVDALVADEQDDDQLSISTDAYSKFVVAGAAGAVPFTPTVPPGLGFPHAHPPPPGLQQPLVFSSSQYGLCAATVVQPPMPVPVTPLKPASGSAVAKSSKRGANAPGSEAKSNIKALALESGLTKDIASHAKASKGKVLQDEDFPALETTKGVMSQVSTPTVPKAPLVKTPAITRRVQADQTKMVPAMEAPATPVSAQKTETKVDRKKAIPGSLNIAAAIKSGMSKKSNPSSAVNSAVEKTDDQSFPALPTPSTLSVSSPAARGGPKTLRLVATPKTEAAPLLSAGVSAPLAFRSAISALRPDTPASENVSDTASIISASVSASRTNSPPPISRIGSAAVRTKTKSQQRKDRKETGKKETAAIISQPVAGVEEIAPISGRKRKQKKERTSTSAGATPVESRPQTPTISSALAPTPVLAVVDKEKEHKPAPLVEEKPSAYRQAVVNESMSLEELPLSAQRLAKVRLDKAQGKDGSRAEDGGCPGEASGQRSERASPSPASVISDLVKAGLTADTETLSLLKSISSASHRQEQYTSSVPKDGTTEVKYFVNEEDQATLLAGKAVHKTVDGARVLLTPYGNCVRNLTPAEEKRYLELQEQIAAAAADPATFIHKRHEPAPGFSVIKGRAVANGPPSYFPQDANTLPSEPIQKMTRDEALNNINQSILPRLNLGTANLATFGRNASKTDHAAATNALNSLAPLILNFAANGVPGTAALAAELSGQSPGSSSAKLDPSDEFSGMAPTSAPPAPLTATPSSTSAAMSASHMGGSAAVGSALNAKSAGGGPFANIPAMSLEDVEQALVMARKETEKLEKSLNQVIKKNRRLLLASPLSGGH